jgi:hypothetical protein
MRQLRVRQRGVFLCMIGLDQAPVDFVHKGSLAERSTAPLSASLYCNGDSKPVLGAGRPASISLSAGKAGFPLPRAGFDEPPGRDW